MVVMEPSDLLMRRKRQESDAKGVLSGIVGASRLPGSVVEAKARERQDLEVPDVENNHRRRNILLNLILNLFRYWVKDEKIYARVVKNYKEEIYAMED